MHIYSIFYSVNSATMWTNTVDKNMNTWNITKQRLTLGCRARVQDHDTKERFKGKRVTRPGNEGHQKT
jgi:hypothetical protein